MKTGHDRLEQFLANPRRAIWTVSGPMMAGMVLMVLSTVVETAMVGRLGHHALAAMTLVFPVLFTMIAVVNGIGTGIAALVAQAIGRRDLKEAERIGGTAIGLGIALGLVFLVCGVFFGHPLLRHMGATEQVQELAFRYFLVLSLSAPLVFVGAFLRFLLNGEGDARTPMVISLFVMVINLGLDYLFLFPLDLGLAGAAMAGAVAQTFSSAALLYLLLFRRNNLVKLHWRALRPDPAAVKSVLAIGIPNSLTQLLMSAGAVLLNRAVASYGDEALAAFGVGSRVDQVAVMPVMGLAAGAVSVIGMFAGAGRADLVKQMTLYAGRWSLTIATVLGFIAFMGSVPLMRAFTHEASTIEFGRHYLSYMVFVYPLMGISMMGARILLGLNFPNLSLAVVAVRLFGFAVPIAYLSAFILHAAIDGIWWGLVAGSVASASATLLLIRWIVFQRDPTERAARRAGPTAGPAEEAAA